MARNETIDLSPGRKLGTSYEVIEHLGSGTEGEVYKILDLETGIPRAAKLFYGDGRAQTRKLVWAAKKLHTLRDCGIVLQYHHRETVRVRGEAVAALVSELCEGEPLARWATRQRGGRVSTYPALQILYRLVCGLEAIHAKGEYHGDVHIGNILAQPRGVGFELKLIDVHNRGRASRPRQMEDLIQAVYVLYDLLGGHKRYGRFPAEVKAICRGMRTDLIVQRFPTVQRLRNYLESFEWEGDCLP